MSLLAAGAWSGDVPAQAASGVGPAHITAMTVRVTAPSLPLWANGTLFRWITRVLWEPQRGGKVVAMRRGYRVVGGRFEIWTPNIASGWYRMVIENKYGRSNGPWVRVYPTARFRPGWGCPLIWNGYTVRGAGGAWITCRRAGASAHWTAHAPARKTTSSSAPTTTAARTTTTKP